jgi:hypothetical protein
MGWTGGNGLDRETRTWGTPQPPHRFRQHDHLVMRKSSTMIYRWRPHKKTNTKKQVLMVILMMKVGCSLNVALVLKTI